MYTNKSAKVKSKRAQLSAKKKQKDMTLNPRVVDLDSQINLISSEQPSEDNNIEVVETQLQKPKTIPAEQTNKNVETVPVNKFNSFNYSRLTKATPAVVQINPEFKKSKVPQIQIVIDDKPLNNNTKQAYKSYTFTLQGQKDQIKIRDAFLRDVASKQLNVLPKNPTNEQTEKTKNSQELIQKLQKKSRYFEVSHEICFKCNKEGHYAKNCINQDMRKCKICFSRLHDEHRCPQTCFECGQSGHISNQCPYSKSQKCERCHQRGHSSNYCGVILRDWQRISNIETYFTQSDLKKMKCINEAQHQDSGKKGPHFNCFVYKDWPMPYHQLRKPQSQSRHSNHHNKHNNQQRPTYKVHQEGYLFTTNPYEHRQEKRDHNYNTYNHQDQRFHNKNDNNKWRNDEFQRYSRSFDQQKKGSRGKWEKKGRNSNRDFFY